MTLGALLCFPPADGGPCVDSSSTIGLTLNAAFVVGCMLFVVIWAMLVRRLWRVRFGEGSDEYALFSRPVPLLALIWLATMTAIEIVANVAG